MAWECSENKLKLSGRNLYLLSKAKSSITTQALLHAMEEYVRGKYLIIEK